MSKRRKVVSVDRPKRPTSSTLDSTQHPSLLDRGIFDSSNFENNVLHLIDEYLEPGQQLCTTHHHYYVALGMSDRYDLALQSVVDLFDIEKCRYIVETFKYYLFSHILMTGAQEAASQNNLEFLTFAMNLLKSRPDIIHKFDFAVKTCIMYAYANNAMEVLPFLGRQCVCHYDIAIEMACQGRKFLLMTWLSIVGVYHNFARQVGFKPPSQEITTFEYIMSMVSRDHEIYTRYLFYYVRIIVCILT